MVTVENVRDTVVDVINRADQSPFEGEGVLVTKAIAAPSDPTVPGALTKIARLFEELPAIILDNLRAFLSLKVWIVSKDGKITEKQTQTFNQFILI